MHASSSPWSMAALLALIPAISVMGCSDPTREPPALPPDAVPAGAVQGSATIRGRVLFAGDPPAPEPINMTSDAGCHGKEDGATREEILVNPDRTLRNVFVHVASGLDGRTFAPPERPVSLDQTGCRYVPHVVGLLVGQPLEILNSDPTLHNVHVEAASNRGFNFGRSVQGQRAIRYFHHPEVMIKAKCDVHPWMSSYIGVVSHPFFGVTGDGGGFSLGGLPAGEYGVEAWHEKLGTLTERVTVGEGEVGEITFTFPE